MEQFPIKPGDRFPRFIAGGDDGRRNTGRRGQNFTCTQNYSIRL